MDNPEQWSREELTEIVLNVDNIDRKVPGSQLMETNMTDSLFNNEKDVFLASNLFKVHLVRNDGATNTASIQRFV